MLNHKGRIVRDPRAKKLRDYRKLNMSGRRGRRRGSAIAVGWDVCMQMGNGKLETASYKEFGSKKVPPSVRNHDPYFSYTREGREIKRRAADRAVARLMREAR